MLVHACTTCILLWCARAAAWSAPSPRHALRHHHHQRPAVLTVMREREPVVDRASKLLGGLLADSFKRALADPEKPVITKDFVFTASTKHIRDVESEDLPEYMLLPVEEYALYDPDLMTRVGADVFEVRLPVGTQPGAPAGLQLKPALRVRVTPIADASQLRIQSISASVFGPAASDTEDGAASTTDGAPSQGLALSGSDSVNATLVNATRALGRLERSLRTADLRFNATLSWRGADSEKKRQGRGKSTLESGTRLTTQVTVRLSLSLPPPFTIVPRLLLQGAVGVVMRSVTDLVLPQFVNLLLADFERWANGTDRTAAVGQLMETSDESVSTP